VAEAPRITGLTQHPAYVPLVVATGAALAVGLGVAVGNPSTVGYLLLAATVGVALACVVAAQPLVGFLIMAASVFFLPVIALTDDKYLNAVDLLMPVMLPVTLFGRQFQKVQEEDRAEAGPAHDAIRGATRRFVQSALVYFGLAALSLVLIVTRIGKPEAAISALCLVRGFEAALLFPLGMMWIRTERDIRWTARAVLVSVVLLGIVNVWHAMFLGHPRGGLTWVVNHPDWWLECPNEAGAAVVVVWAVLLARNKFHLRTWDYLVMAMIFLTLVITQSRSGLLAMALFTMLTIRRLRARYVIGGIGVIGLALLVAPYAFWYRMTMTATLHKGSWEMYSWLVRVYGYVCSLRMFLHNWVTGLGYLAGRYVSENYNELRLKNLGAENFFLETAVGMGVIGLIAVLYWLVRLFRLGSTVKRVAPPGTLGHELARLHTPLMVAMVGVCMVGDNWVGMVATGQTVVWCVLLLRAGHLAVDGNRWRSG
jgi:O-antigen ligase